MLPGQHCSRQPNGLGQRPSWPRGLGLSLPSSPNPRYFILVVVLMGSGASQCQTLSQDRNPAVLLEGKESKITLQLSMPMPEKVGHPFLFDA